MLSRLKQGVTLIAAVYTHPANKGRKAAAISRMLAWQLHKKFKQQPKIIDYHGFKFICFLDSHASSSAIYFNCFCDYPEMKFMQSYLRPGDHFIDIGANVGLYTLIAASVIKSSGSIDAFEAIPATADKLRQQLTTNQLKNVHLHPVAVAVADKNAHIVFDLTTDDCTAHILGTEQQAAHRGQRIQSVTLDSYLSTDNRYAMGKMDIEGAEILALKGAKKMLQAGNPAVWQLELAGYSVRYGTGSDQIIEFLGQHGYACAIFQPNSGKLHYTDKPWEKGASNILAIHKQQKDFVNHRLAIGYKTSSGTQL